MQHSAMGDRRCLMTSSAAKPQQRVPPGWTPPPASAMAAPAGNRATPCAGDNPARPVCGLAASTETSTDRGARPGSSMNELHGRAG